MRKNGGYDAFGSLLPGRNYSSDAYRFGFQGQEKDDEIHGATGTSYAFEYRMHDPRVGRFLSVDPLAAKYPHNSPYAFSENRVIASLEIEGLEAWDMNSRDPNYQMMNSEQKAQFRQDAQAPAAYGMALGLAAGMDLAFTKGAASRFVVGMMAAQTVEHNTATSPQGQAMQEQRTSANVSNLLLLYGTGKLATALAPAAQTTSTTAPLLQVAATQETTLLYRGVNNSHVAFAEAELGIVRANGGTATPLQHNTVPGATLWSPFTSWTTNPAVAENFALRPNGSGVVIQAEVPLSQTVMSPNLKSVLLKQSGNIVSESEVLVGGTVKGTPTKVP